MPHEVINPAELHNPVPFGYSHTASVPAGAGLVLVAGQYGCGPDGMVVSSDFAEQVRQSFDNLSVALSAHGLGLSHVAQLRTYVVDIDFDKLAAVGETVQRNWRSTPPTQTALGVASLAMPQILFEVEALAVRP